MPDFKKTYTGEGTEKTVKIEVDESALGLNQFNILNEAISEEMKNGLKHFSLDLSNLKSVNSSGLGILISCLKKIKDSVGSLKIINANEKIINIFKLTKLTNVFEFESST